MNARQQKKIVKRGSFLYANTVECAVEIVETNFRPGSGDHEDEPEFRDDKEGTFYDIEYQSAGGTREFLSAVIGFESVEAAIRHVESAVASVRWVV